MNKLNKKYTKGVAVCRTKEYVSSHCNSAEGRLVKNLLYCLSMLRVFWHGHKHTVHNDGNNN